MIFNENSPIITIFDLPSAGQLFEKFDEHSPPPDHGRGLSWAPPEKSKSVPARLPGISAFVAAAATIAAAAPVSFGAAAPESYGVAAPVSFATAGATIDLNERIRRPL